MPMSSVELRRENDRLSAQGAQDMTAEGWRDLGQRAEAAFNDAQAQLAQASEDEMAWMRSLGYDRAAIGGQLNEIDKRAADANPELVAVQSQAKELAATMATVAPERENPFRADELREAYDAEKLDFARGMAFEAGRHGEPIPLGIEGSRMLLEGYGAGLDDRATGLAFTREREGDRATERDDAELLRLREESRQALSRLPEDRNRDMGASNPEWARAVQAAELAIESRHMNDPRAADPVIGMGMAIPASKQFAAYERAEQLAHSEDIDRAQPGKSYSGKVLDVTQSYVFQQSGDQVIAHDRQALSGRPVAEPEALRGRNVEIAYPHGRAGLVRDQERQDRGQREQGLQNDYGRDRER